MIGDFLKERCNILKPGVDIALDISYSKSQTEISEGNILPGDTVPLLLEEFQKLLKPRNLGIVLWDNGDDHYYIGVASQNDIKRLDRNSLGYKSFVAYGSKTGEVLYTVNCSCGSMNVWQLKRGELLTDDYGQDCGKELFDKQSNSSLPVAKDYI